MSRKYFVKKNLAASIGYILGVLAHKYTYPTAYLLATSNHDKDTVCKLARHLNLKVRLHKGEWQEQKRSINDIIKSKEYGQEKEIKD